jgi:hypothetical protein
MVHLSYGSPLSWFTSFVVHLSRGSPLALGGEVRMMGIMMMDDDAGRRWEERYSESTVRAQ